MTDDAWQFPALGLELRVHPRYLLDAQDMTLIKLWQLHDTGGFAPGPLPFAGGSADQPACVMDALAIMSAAKAKLRPAKENRHGH